jgi:uncharacterized protein
MDMENKDYIGKIDENAERRFCSPEIRVDAESRKVSGYAAVFNKDSENLGGFIERIAPGAFDDVLKDDAVALLNHDQNLVLARNGVTMNLSVDSKGLKYEFDAPDTTAGNDLLENLRLKNISKSSFAFNVKTDKWESRKEAPDLRTIEKMSRLFDVSPVTYPAYPDTTVALRGLAKTKEEKEEENIPITTYKKQVKRLKLKMRRR